MNNEIKYVYRNMYTGSAVGIGPATEFGTYFNRDKFKRNLSTAFEIGPAQSAVKTIKKQRTPFQQHDLLS